MEQLFFLKYQSVAKMFKKHTGNFRVQWVGNLNFPRWLSKHTWEISLKQCRSFSPKFSDNELVYTLLVRSNQQRSHKQTLVCSEVFRALGIRKRERERKKRCMCCLFTPSVHTTQIAQIQFSQAAITLDGMSLCLCILQNCQHDGKKNIWQKIQKNSFRMWCRNCHIN